MSDDDYLKCSCKECGNRIAFPAQSAGTVVSCPHCGQWTELNAELRADTPPETTIPNKRPVGLVLLVGFLVVAGAAGGFWFWRSRANVAAAPPPEKLVATATNPPATTPAPAKPAASEKRQKSPDDLKVGTVKLEKAKVGSLVYAVGVVTNASEFQRFGVTVELELYGQNGKKLGVARDYKDIIEPNREWQFHALIPDSRTASAKVVSVKED